MGQKVHPIGFRVGITRGWNSSWFAKHNYGDLLLDDLRIRKYVKERLSHAGVSKVEIERDSQRARINIWTARPGIIIESAARRWTSSRRICKSSPANQVNVNIKEVRKAEMTPNSWRRTSHAARASRIAFRRAMKKAVTSAFVSAPRV